MCGREKGERCVPGIREGFEERIETHGQSKEKASGKEEEADSTVSLSLLEFTDSWDCRQLQSLQEEPHSEWSRVWTAVAGKLFLYGCLTERVIGQESSWSEAI